ncbi:MAG TPA: response regulator transcription factor [Devosiaceae bacterium]
MRILLVEDTEDVAEAIVQRFQQTGHACDLAVSRADAEDFAAVEAYDLVILDINLPDGSGLDFLKWLRSRRNGVPVLVLTARMATDDKINALDVGADDYLVKPFDFRELEARARAITRRQQGESAATVECGNLRFDTAARQVTVAGVPCELTRREQILLEIFLANRGRVLDKEELHNRLFGFEGETGLNAVEVYVARLRRKLAGADLHIRTLRGLGYQASETGRPS